MEESSTERTCQLPVSSTHPPFFIACNGRNYGYPNYAAKNIRGTWSLTLPGICCYWDANIGRNNELDLQFQQS